LLLKQGRNNPLTSTGNISGCIIHSNTHKVNEITRRSYHTGNELNSIDGPAATLKCRHDVGRTSVPGAERTPHRPSSTTQLRTYPHRTSVRPDHHRIHHNNYQQINCFRDHTTTHAHHYADPVHHHTANSDDLKVPAALSAPILTFHTDAECTQLPIPPHTLPSLRNVQFGTQHAPQCPHTGTPLSRQGAISVPKY
jgi:hypothetical protein